MRPRPSASGAEAGSAPARTPGRRPDGSGARRWRLIERCCGGVLLAGAMLPLLVGCGSADRAIPTAQASPPGLCRLGPDDGPPLADRGIGGAGAPTAIADRGIGGTGAPLRIADRGIGGTGIVAVITGFASICLGGVEVALDPGVPVTRDGQTIPAADLRAGQLAIVEASGAGAALSARSVHVRQEVSGPVEAVGTDGSLRVAGQPVQITPTTFGDRRLLVGQWVGVSGLRGPDGVVQATRLDLRAPGEVLVRGQAVLTDGRARIGGLELRPVQPMETGGFVTAIGRYRGGSLAEARVEPDRLAADPGAAFPATTRRILVESYAMAGQGGLRLGPGAVVPAAGGLGGAAPQRAVVELQRQPGGGVRATGWRPEGPGPASAPAAGPAGFGHALGGSATSGMARQPAPVPRRMPAGMGAASGRRVPGGNVAPQRGMEPRPPISPPDSPVGPSGPPPGDAGRGPPRPR